MDDALHEAYDDLGGAFVERAFTAPWNRFYDQLTVVGLLQSLAGKMVLDVGCGPGAYFEALLARGARRYALVGVMNRGSCRVSWRRC
jgi:2-polyprenyl-3-methyl-5-hydroxy-6-metoxy-1,4-benzoquinol methylase